MNLAQIIEDALTASAGTDVFVYRLDGVMLEIEIGIHEHEQGRNQNIRIDVVTVVSTRDWDRSDSINSVINYDYLLEAIEALKTRRFNLQETLCGEILDAALAPDAVLAAAVTTRKTDVYEHAESVGLTRFRRK